MVTQFVQHTITYWSVGGEIWGWRFGLESVRLERLGFEFPPGAQ